jgi:hypothetical protein
MRITVPEAREFQLGRTPSDRTVPFGATLGAQYGRVFDPVFSQLSYYTGTPTEYDPDSIERVESYIQMNGLSDRDARYLRIYGLGSQENFQAALEFNKRDAERRDVLDRSTGLNLFVSDPAIHVSFFVPPILKGSSALLGRALNALPMANRVGALRQVVRAQQLMRGEAITAKSLAKLGGLEAAVVDGSMSLTQALSEISVGADPVDELTNAALLTAGMTAFGATLGYGFGAALSPSRAGIRSSTFTEGYKTYLNGVSDKPLERGEDVSFTGKWFTESIFMKAVPTALRTTIQDATLPEWSKLFMLELGGDNSMPLVMNQIGRTTGSSVFIEAGRRQGDWYKALSIIDEGYRQVSPRGNATVLNVPVAGYIEAIRRRLGKDSFAPDDWYNHIGRLYIDEVPYDKMTPQEASSVQAIDAFFTKYESELTEVGIINPKEVFVDTYMKEAGRQFEMMGLTSNIIEQNRRWMRQAIDEMNVEFEAKSQKLRGLAREEGGRGLTDKQLAYRKTLEDEITDIQGNITRFDDLFERINKAQSPEDLAKLYDELDLTPTMRSALKNLDAEMAATRARIDEALRVLELGKGRQTRRYFPRFFNRRAIEQDRDSFRGILIKWFRENPEKAVRKEDGSIEVVRFSTNPEDLAKRADDAINNILGEMDDDGVDAIFSGYGRTGPLISKRLDIPNELVKDFIVTDVKEAMIAYTRRVAPRLEFHKKFRDPETGRILTLEAHLDRMRTRLLKDGVSERNVDRYLKNFVATYDQVVGNVLKRPDAIDNRIADWLRTATSWTYLGSSGIAALGDAASLFMDNELRSIGNAFIGLMDDVSIGMSKRELNLAGEALELTNGTTHLRYMESLTNDIFSKGIPDKLNNAFYIANGLAPVTIAMKSLNGLLSGHTIIDYSRKLIDGKATKFEREWLARYQIDEAMARRFLDMPTEKSNAGLNLPNTEAWTDEEAVNAFRNALRSSVMNRVIMASPADKPIVMGGVAYIPDSLAKMLPFDLPVDPRVKGYRRVESGLMALPFTFYSYTMGALTKITANHAAGAVRNRLTHMAVAMTLGAMIVKFRTPSWAWDQMDTEDKIMRAFDFSGLAALYSDMLYRGISMAEELGADVQFPIQPKFKSDPDPLGAILSVGGAPVDWSYNILKSTGQMVRGDMQDGALGLIRSTPLIGAIIFNGVLKDAAKDLARELPNRQ